MEMKKIFSKNWITERTNRKNLSELTRYSKGNLLDIGCGNKPYSSIFEPYITNYIGLEHRDTPFNKNGIDLFGDGCNLPFVDSCFDTIVSFQVLEHVKEPNEMLSEIFRVLKCNSFAILSTPFMWGIHQEPHDYYRFTKYGLSYLCKKNGFEIIQLEANSGFWVMACLRFNYYIAKFERRRTKMIFAPIYYLIQRTALFLDTIDKMEKDTISYTVVLKKP